MIRFGPFEAGYFDKTLWIAHYAPRKVREWTLSWFFSFKSEVVDR